MARPTDWDVLDLTDDPTPGDPQTSRGVSRTWNSVADAAERAETGVRSLLGDQAVLQWIGKAGDVFRDHGSKLPDQLAKAKESYQQAADAMTWWAGQLETCQSDADRALAQGRVARADLNTAQSHLGSAQAAATSAGQTATALNTPPPDGSTAPPPDPAKVQAAARAATSADNAVTAAQSAVGDAQSRLDVAKRLAADAAHTRDGAGHTTSGKLHDAADAGIANDSFWHKLGDALSHAWHVLVEIAKVVVAVLAIVCLVVGGPLAWVLLAAAIIVLADTAIKYAQGKASLWDVALAALSCIPMTKGLTTLAELRNAGGLLKAGALILKSGKNAMVDMARSAKAIGAGGSAFIKSFAADLADVKVGIATMADTGLPVVMVDGKGVGVMFMDAKKAAGIERGRQLVGSTPRSAAESAGEQFPLAKKYPELAEKYPDGVQFTAEGFPDFAPYATHSVELPSLGPTRTADFRAANQAAGLDRTPPGMTWHHVENGTTMQLVPSDLHRAVPHTGGWARHQMLQRGQ